MCLFCPEKHKRQDDIRQHVSHTHADSFPHHGSHPEYVNIPQCSPSTPKRPRDYAEDQTVTPKRTRLDPFLAVPSTVSTPSSPIAYAIPEAQTDFTVVPSSPILELDDVKQDQIIGTAEFPSKPVTQHRRRAAVKQFTLAAAGIYFHQPTRLLVCVECTHAVPAEQLATHINESCPRNIRYDVALLTSKLQEIGAHLPPLLPNEGLDSPIPLLPIITGWRCVIPGPCFGRTFGACPTRNKHHKDHHPHEKSSFSECKCQKIFKNPKITRYAFIKPANDSTDPRNPSPKGTWRDLKQKLTAEGALTLKDERAVTRMQLSPLEIATHWHLTLKTADLSLVRLYSRPPGPAPADSIYQRLFAAFRQYIVNIVAPVLQTRSNTMLLRLINSSDK